MIKIFLFSDGVALLDGGFVPDFKTEVGVEGCGVTDGTLSLGAQNFSIKDGVAVVPYAAWADGNINVTVTAKTDKNKMIIFRGDALRGNRSDGYVPATDYSGRDALIATKRECDTLRAEIAELKKSVAAINKKIKTQLFAEGE